MPVFLKNFYRSKLLPHNYIAEEILLGVILTYPKIFIDVFFLIKEESFFLEYHQIIYRNFIDLNEKRELNTIELIYKLGNTKYLHQIGGFHKIIDLMKQSQIFIPPYNKYLNLYTRELIQLINFAYIKRILIQYSYNIIKLAYNPKISYQTIHSKISSYLDIAEQKIPHNNLKTFQTLVSEFLLNIKQKNKSEKKIKADNITIFSKTFNNSGFKKLDQLISSFKPGDLIIIAGRPSIGKTSFAINIAYNIFTHISRKLCIFSLETSSKQIIYKFIAISSEISLQNFLNKKITIQQWNHIKQICYEFLKAHIYIDDTSNMSIDYIEYTSKILSKEKKKINLIIIDYLQLIQTQNSENNRAKEISYITRKLKLLAQSLEVPIITLSQLNRSIEIRSNKKPMLSDLKESGCIDYKTKILIKKYYGEVNMTCYKDYSQYINSIQFITNTTCKEKIQVNNSKLKQQIYAFIQHIFNVQINIYSINLTYNHKYISEYSWKKTNNTIDKDRIIQINNKYYINIYINKIKYICFEKTYDINTLNYFNFLCKKIILHNSIEQDSDIVMILYKHSTNFIYNEAKQIISIYLCKNRNGPTGECKLFFYPATNKFKDSLADDLI